MNSKELLFKIDSLYGNKLSYLELCSAHKELIESIDHLLIHTDDFFPNNNTRVFCVQDLSFMGKGIFLCDFWYRKQHGFVSDPYADDGYGFITKWVYHAKIDKSVI